MYYLEPLPFHFCMGSVASLNSFNIYILSIFLLSAMDHSTYNPYLEAHETATQYSYSFDHRYTIMRENIDSSDPNKRLEGLVKLR